MHFTRTASLLASLTAAANAALVARQLENVSQSDLALVQYFLEVCLPVDESAAMPDFNAPCNAVEAIATQCLYGSEAFESNYTGLNPPFERASPEQEQDCFCDSEYFHLLGGCISCAEAHGVGAAVPMISELDISGFSSSYCAATSTPTAGMDEVLVAAFSSAASAAASPTVTSFSDPIGSRTEVSLYFTPTVSGSDAYIVSQAAVTTSASSSGAPTVSPIPNTSNQSSGQTANPASTSTTTSTGLAAVATPCLERYVFAGAVGLVGAVAML